MKASDIPDAAILEAVERTRKARGFSSATRWDVEKSFPNFPAKVVFAKLRQMVNKGRLDGCPCGCRGDFTLKPKIGDKFTLAVSNKPN